MQNKKVFKIIREKMGMTEEQLASLIGVSPRTIRNYEKGTRKISKTVWILMGYIRDK